VGFTLVELLVAMTVIAILAGILVVAAGRGITSAREFAIRNEMLQLTSAIEQFRNEFSFYPPSFKAINGPDAMLVYLNRIAPNHVEGAGPVGMRPIDLWWSQVGQFIVQNPGADLVFWLSGLARDKQRPLTHFDANGGNPILHANAAHNYSSDPDEPPKRVFFEFKVSRLNIDPAVADGRVAEYSQTDRSVIPYLYLDARNYLPSISNPMDGAYVRPGVTGTDLVDVIENGADPRPLYFNPDSFQLLSYGLDGLPGNQAPSNDTPAGYANFFVNDCAFGGPAAADNFVNFGSEEISKLVTIIEEAASQP
jgi:prepilin-type N-terminal cleavage/methylation domain-containing protein